MNYLLEVTLCWAVFFGIYQLLLRAETFHRTNRWYLLGTLLLGLVIPMLDVNWLVEPTSPVYILQPITVGVQELEAVVITASQQEQGIDYQAVLLWMYWLGVVVSLARFGYGLWQIRQLYRSGDIAKQDSYDLVTTSAPHLPFSFFRNLFWSKNFVTTEEERRSIVRHEEAHIFQKHSHDVVLLELVAAFAWCVPFVYFYKKALKTTHEYLADAYVTAGFDKKQYGRLLLRQSHPGMQVAISNSLFSSQLKKRIVMMTKTKSAQGAALKYLAVLPAVAVLLMAFSFAGNMPNPTLLTDNQLSEKVNELILPDTIPTGEKVYQTVDEMPRFPGCEDLSKEGEREQCSQAKLFEFLSKNLKYPAVAKEKAIEGMVVVKFVVQKDGSLADIDIIKGIGSGCDEEVLRIVDLMPKWIPGQNVRKPVAVEFKLPIRFKLDNTAPITDEQVLTEVDEMPEMAGCENLSTEERKKCSEEKMFQAIFTNLKYPKEAREKGIEGTVFVKFVIQKDGSVANIETLKSVGYGCDEEVIRVVSNMPKWVPAKKDGKPVATSFTLPIKFKLDNVNQTSLPDADTKADNPALLSLNIYPNPASDRLVVTYDVRTAASLRFADATGKEVGSIALKATDGKAETTVSMKDFPKGMLYVTLSDSGGKLLGTRILLVE